MTVLSSYQPQLSQIWIYPIKSLDGVSVAQATLTPQGALTLDREFALVDAAGQFVNAKRTAHIHRVRSQFDLADRYVTLSSPEQDAQTFDLDRDRTLIAAWFTTFFGFEIQLIQNQATGFPDDLKANGPTIISTTTLETVASWFEGISTDEMRSRLRTNLELSGVPAFWEDCLFTEPFGSEGFKIGAVKFQGTNPCQRCIVPTRDPQTGAVFPHFQRTFSQKRQQSLPDWVNPKAFNHYYRLAVNTKIVTQQQALLLKRGETLIVAP